MVLFLFVVTMLAPEQDEQDQDDRIAWQKAVGSLLGLVLVGALSYLLFNGASSTNLPKASAAESLSNVVNHQANVEAFGQAPSPASLFPFQLTTFLIAISILC